MYTALRALARVCIVIKMYLFGANRYKGDLKNDFSRRTKNESRY